MPNERRSFEQDRRGQRRVLREPGEPPGWGKSLNPERYERARRLADAGDLDQAAELIRQEVESAEEPEEKGAGILFETSLLLELREYDRVRQRLMEADRLLPPESDGRMILEYQAAEVDTFLGKRAEALSRLEGLDRCNGSLLSSPDYRNIWRSVQIRRGVLLFGLGRLKEAEGFLERALEFESEEKNADFYNVLGMCNYHSGKLEDAEKQILMALRLGLSPYWEVKAREYLGALYFKRQAYALAKAEYEWCLSHAQDSDVPRKELLKSLAVTSRMLNLPNDAAEYERMARRE